MRKFTEIFYVAVMVLLFVLFVFLLISVIDAKACGPGGNCPTPSEEIPPTETQPPPPTITKVVPPTETQPPPTITKVVPPTKTLPPPPTKTQPPEATITATSVPTNTPETYPKPKPLPTRLSPTGLFDEQLSFPALMGLALILILIFALARLVRTRL